MATKTNKITAAFIKQKLNALYDARVVWENGVYKTSNDELYNLLDKCLVLFKELTGERSLIKELNELLEARGAKLTNGTSLATKIVRYVFRLNALTLTLAFSLSLMLKRTTRFQCVRSSHRATVWKQFVRLRRTDR
jgi:hypothetical protein